MCSLLLLSLLPSRIFTWLHAGSSGSPGLACDDGERIVHQENKDKMVNKDHPVIKDYLEIPYLSNEPLKENKENN